MYYAYTYSPQACPVAAFFLKLAKCPRLGPRNHNSANIYKNMSSVRDLGVGPKTRTPRFLKKKMY